MLLIPKNWTSFQHYKDRAPPWIKLHKGLLDDSAFQRLPVASRALAPMLWLLASEEKDGAFCGDAAELAFRLRQSEEEITSALKPLIDNGFFILVRDAIKPLADCMQLAVPETETEREAKTEREAEKPTGFVLPFWINADHWNTWHSCPKREKANNAQKQMTVDKLMAWRDQGLDYAGALENAALGGYQGLFLPDKGKQDVARQTVPAKPGPDPMQAVFDARDRKAAPIPQAIREQMAKLTNMVKQ